MKTALLALVPLMTLALTSSCSKAPQAESDRSRPEAESFESQVASLLIAPPEAVTKSIAAPERAALIRELRFEDETAQRKIREHLYQVTQDEWNASPSSPSSVADEPTDRQAELLQLFWNFIESVYQNAGTRSSFRDESLATLWSLSEMEGTLLAPHARLVLAALRPSKETSRPGRPVCRDRRRPAGSPDDFG